MNEQHFEGGGWSVFYCYQQSKQCSVLYEDPFECGVIPVSHIQMINEKYTFSMGIFDHLKAFHVRLTSKTTHNKTSGGDGMKYTHEENEMRRFDVG
jgi:hypothetical protein